MQNTEDVPACMRLEVIYVLLHLHDLVVILSTKRGNRFIQILEPFQSPLQTLTPISHQESGWQW